MSEKRKSLIKKLLDTNHLNNVERKELYPFKISFDEICEYVEQVLNLNGNFPPSAKLWSEGEVVHEGCIIKKDGEKYHMYLQRSNPSDNRILAEQKKFENAIIRDAVRQFCKIEYPEGNIDGIKIE